MGILHISKTLSGSLTNSNLLQQVTRNAVNDGGGLSIPAGLSSPPPPPVYQIPFCYNKSLEMPWMMGGGGGLPIPAGLSYPPSMIFEL